MDDAFGLLKKAWDEKVGRFGRILHESATSVKLFPMPLSSLGGWHPDSHRAMGSIAVNIALRALSSVDYARSAMFQRHAALLVANNDACLIFRFDFQILRHWQKETSLYADQKPRCGPIAILRPVMQNTYHITISRFGCNPIAKFHSFSPEQNAKGHSVQPSWTPMGIIYCIAKEVRIEFGDMMRSYWRGTLQKLHVTPLLRKDR